MLKSTGMETAREEAILSALQSPRLDETMLDQAERALLHYAEKLTLAPGSVEGRDIEPLRAAGLDDVAIHDACSIIGYFAFVNRIADGLGVELEG